MQLQVAADGRAGQRDERGIGMRAISHAGLVAGHQRRRDQRPGRRTRGTPRCAAAPLQQLAALLVSGRVVQLLVLLGRVVRVGDAPVDERRRRPRSCGIRRSRRRSGSAGLETSISPARFSARASNGECFGGRCAALQAPRSISPRRWRRRFGDQVAAKLRANNHIPSPSNSGSSERPCAMARKLLASSARSRRRPPAAPAPRAMSPSSRSKSTHSIAPVGHRLGRRLQRGHLARPRQRRPGRASLAVAARPADPRGHALRRGLGASACSSCTLVLAGQDARRHNGAGAAVQEQRALARRAPARPRSSLTKLVAFTSAVSSAANVRDISRCTPPSIRRAPLRRESGQVAQQPRLAHRQHARQARRAAAQSASSRHGRCGRSSARRAGHRRACAATTCAHGSTCGARLGLQHPVVEEARRAIGLAVHLDQPHLPASRVDRLRQPARVAGDFSGAWNAGHPPP